MLKPKVYVTRSLPRAALTLLESRCDVEMNPGHQTLSKTMFFERVKDKDAILVSHTTIDAEICELVKGRCKIFASYGVGYNNIDIAAASRCGILVTNTPEAVTAATADHAWALILATARRIVECDRFVRDGRKEWGPSNLIGTQVSEQTLGVIGPGRIGTAVGKRAMGFDMRVVYCSKTPNAEFEAATNGTYVTKEALLEQSDFVTIHVPLLPSTHHLIGINELRMMKSTAVLINVARGEIVDEVALVKALRDGAIAGAGLDVFEHEPELYQGLAELPNVVLTPHNGTATLHTRIKQGESCAKNIFAALDGQTPPNCLNPGAERQR